MATEDTNHQQQDAAAQQQAADDDYGNDFLLILSQFNKGRLLAEVNQKLGDLLGAVNRYEKKGTFVLKFEFAPGPEVGTVETKGTVDAKAPQPEHPSIFFVDAARGHRLRRDDPNAVPLF